jgi:hypothetical protein
LSRDGPPTYDGVLFVWTIAPIWKTSCPFIALSMPLPHGVHKFPPAPERQSFPWRPEFLLMAPARSTSFQLFMPGPAGTSIFLFTLPLYWDDKCHHAQPLVGMGSCELSLPHH